MPPLSAARRIRAPSFSRRNMTIGSRVLFVLRCAGSRSGGVLLAHVRALFRGPVIFRSALVVDVGARIDPDNRIAGTVLLRCGFGREFCISRGLASGGRRSRGCSFLGEAGLCRTGEFLVRGTRVARCPCVLLAFHEARHGGAGELLFRSLALAGRVCRKCVGRVKRKRNCGGDQHANYDDAYYHIYSPTSVILYVLSNLSNLVCRIAIALLSGAATAGSP